MKVLPSSNIEMQCSNEMIPSYEEIMIAIMNRVDVVTRDYGYLLPKGWRLIAELDCINVGKLRLDLQSDKGGGSFAEVKMKTLTDFAASKPATGIDNIGYIQELIEMNGLANSEVGAEIIAMHSTAELRRYYHEWLKEKIGYTNFYGAIQVPFQNLSIFPTEVGNNNLRLAFSGASEEQDVMFAVWVLSEFQKAIVDVFNRTHFVFNLDAFDSIPNVKLWFDLLDIHRSLCP